MNFLVNHIPSCKDDCKVCEKTTAQKLESKEGTVLDDPLEDIKQYVHTILDSDDLEDIECKDSYNKALIHNKEVHILHDKLEDLNKLDGAQLEEMRCNYDPKSKDIFESTWDLSDSNEDDNIVNKMYEGLSNLKIEDNSESDNSESSSN